MDRTVVQIWKEEGNVTRHMLNAQEAADYLRISYWTLLQYAKTGRIPHVCIGRRVLCSQEGLDQWLEEQEAKSVEKKLGQTGYGNLRKAKAG